MAVVDLDVNVDVGSTVPRQAGQLLDKWQSERRKLDRIDRWARWDHDDPHRPRQSTAEYKELAARAQSPWGSLLVTSIAQTLYVEGYRRADGENAAAWRAWQANQMDARQIAIHRAALTYGLAYSLILPGTTFTGEPMPVIRGVSPREMVAFYDDPAFDEWPKVALRVRSQGSLKRLTFLDEEAKHTLTTDAVGATPKLIRSEVHGAQVCPVVRFANRFDLEGRAAGEVEPFIPILGRIDQTTFDRLVVQRFASWVVRTISGMSVNETTKATGETAKQAKLRLAVEDILVGEDPDTKFGSLPATPLGGFIDANEYDVRTLSSVSQTPSHEMLGQIANLSADALAAAKASQVAKSGEIQHGFGESHEQQNRMAAHLMGDSEGAADFEAFVVWGDHEIRSLAQSADALGKLATMLGVPVEILWEKIPGFTQQDVERAKALVTDGGLDQLVRQLTEGATSQESTVFG